MRRPVFLTALLIVALTFASCQEPAKAPETPQPTPTVPVPTPKPTPIPSPTPPSQEITVPAEGSIAERLRGAKIGDRDAVKYVKPQGTTGRFSEGRYIIGFNQPLDHKNISKGNFSQEVILSVADLSKPVVFVTQGYDLESWGFYSSDYTEELVRLLDCNQVIIEHRFFGESVPSPRNWEYHTIENEVNDLHVINRILREIFKDQKFISTGRSKGGQTAIYYSSFFPEDIDICVPYVAPLMWQMNDMRNAEFLKNVGSESRRKQIHDFQQAMFDNRAKYISEFEQWSKSAGYPLTSYRVDDWNILYDLCVLEYSFMCWQYNPSSSIPSTPSLYSLWEKSNPSYFSEKDNPAFMVNVLRDLGYYGYDVKQFSNTVITQAQADRWIEDIAAPSGAKFQFDPKVGLKAKEFLKNNTEHKMIFIYGEYDSWSACAVEWENFDGKTNMFRYDSPGGDHSAFISTLSSAQRQEVENKLKEWIAE